MAAEKMFPVCPWSGRPSIGGGEYVPHLPMEGEIMFPTFQWWGGEYVPPPPHGWGETVPQLPMVGEKMFPTLPMAGERMFLTSAW